MKELHYFKNSGNPEISVALAGINKHEWVFAKSGEPLEKCVSKMLANKFDVLPIIEIDGTTRKCYKTTNWSDYSIENIEQYEITQGDRLYFLTHIHDAITKFAKTNRKFFFLDNQDEIIGLLVLGNLNCKHVYLYLYNLIIQLEHAMGKYIYKNKIKDLDLIELFGKRTESGNAKNALERFKEDDRNGLDYDFIEYLYLTDLYYIFKRYGFIEKLDMKQADFKSIISKVNDLRTIVAHPNKSLIRNENSIHDLFAAITGIDFLLERIKV